MSGSSDVVHFPPFRLDLVAGRLWREEHEVVLRAKTLAVLRHLVLHAGRFVSKEELLDTIWPDVYVSDVVPLVCVRELRKVFADDAKNPRFIQTMRRRGIRFLAPTFPDALAGVTPEAEGLDLLPPLPSPRQVHPLKVRVSNFVGREAELLQLDRLWAQALHGERQLVFVTGEPGIGKTALIEAFRQRLETGSGRTDAAAQSLPSESFFLSVKFAHGQCIEHHGPGEASLQMTLALALVATEGYASHELVTTYQRARELAAHSKSAIRRFWVLMGLHDFHATRGEFVVTREIAEDVMRLADVTADPAIRFSGHLLLGYNAYCRGELAEARRHFDYEAGASDTSSSFARTYTISDVSWPFVRDFGLPRTSRGRAATCRATGREAGPSLSVGVLFEPGGALLSGPQHGHCPQICRTCLASST